MKEAAVRSGVLAWALGAVVAAGCMEPGELAAPEEAPLEKPGQAPPAEPPLTTSAPGFELVWPDDVALAQGATLAHEVGITSLGGFTGQVVMSATTSYPLALAFSPSTVTAPGRTALSITAPCDFPAVPRQVQVTGTSGTFAFLTNAGSAQVKGIEIEAVARPMDGLQFSGNFNLLSAKLVEDQINDLVIASGRKGDRIPNIPNVSIAVAGDYSWRIGNGGLKGLVHADLNYVGRSYADFRPTAVTYRRVGDYVLASLRVGLSNERWGAFLFANNLSDTVARTSAANVLGGRLETITTAPPRTIGINLTTNF